MNHNILSSLKTKIFLFPKTCGVYIMRNKKKSIIYVGKAKSLRHRVSSYFNPKNTPKVSILMKNVHSIDYRITSSEYEALLLEHNLIKSHKPKYNILLKDDKTFPVICVTKEKFPKIFKTRTIRNDKSTYYGPYVNINLLNIYLQLIEKLYPLRRCKNIRWKKHPCLYYHIDRCAAVCAKKISEKEYNTRIQKIQRLLAGNTKKLKKTLTLSMHNYAKKKNFEEAKKYRDIIIAIENIQQESSIIAEDNSTIYNYIGYAENNSHACFTVIHMKGNTMLETHTSHAYIFDTLQESFERFLIAYHAQHTLVSDILFLPLHIENETKVFFKRKYSTTCKIPSTSQHRSIMKAAKENAMQALRKKEYKQGNLKGVQALQNVLQLKTPPLYIEGFDIAHVEGTHTVAAMVCFVNGVPQKKEYRHFIITTVKKGHIDDYASLQEVIARRYMKVKDKKKSMPDCIVIDGGIGQTNSTQDILNTLKLPIPLIGLAKKHEEIFFPTNSGIFSPLLQKGILSNPLQLDKTHIASRLLQAIRNEAHRFGTRFRAKKQKASLSLSLYTSVTGIGPIKAKKLINVFSSFEDIIHSPPEIISKVINVKVETVKELQKLIYATYFTKKNSLK